MLCCCAAATITAVQQACANYQGCDCSTEALNGNGNTVTSPRKSRSDSEKHNFFFVLKIVLSLYLARSIGCLALLDQFDVCSNEIRLSDQGSYVDADSYDCNCVLSYKEQAANFGSIEQTSLNSIRFNSIRLILF